jgi:hypothetical protein
LGVFLKNNAHVTKTWKILIYADLSDHTDHPKCLPLVLNPIAPLVL